MNRIRFVLITASILPLAAAASRQPRTKNSPRERFQPPPKAAYTRRIPDFRIVYIQTGGNFLQPGWSVRDVVVGSAR